MGLIKLQKTKTLAQEAINRNVIAKQKRNYNFKCRQ